MLAHIQSAIAEYIYLQLMAHWPGLTMETKVEVIAAAVASITIQTDYPLTPASRYHQEPELREYAMDMIVWRLGASTYLALNCVYVPELDTLYVQSNDRLRPYLPLDEPPPF